VPANEGRIGGSIASIARLPKPAGLFHIFAPAASFSHASDEGHERADCSIKPLQRRYSAVANSKVEARGCAWPSPKPLSLGHDGLRIFADGVLANRIFADRVFAHWRWRYRRRLLAR